MWPRGLTDLEVSGHWRISCEWGAPTLKKKIKQKILFKQIKKKNNNKKKKKYI